MAVIIGRVYNHYLYPTKLYGTRESARNRSSKKEKREERYRVETVKLSIIIYDELFWS